MKLISCCIENFGGLSGFSLDFQEGLTVIHQPNGFGKTTLAEFIRAMFYGFPRKTPKTLGRREKYRPWNGGKCRGHLTFEHEGVRYRIERTFGASPKGDTCKIYDLDTGRESTRFSADIGLELFGLDADSFERSTYLPQSRESGPLTTDSIRAKLGDLVEDTGDVGNFEKAMEALRAKRSAYVPYRGRGGAVAEDMEGIIRTQQALDDAAEAAREQAQAAGALAELEQEQTRVAAEIDNLRQELSAAAEAALRRARRMQYENLTDSLNDANARLGELEKAYPKGFPGDEDLKSIADAVEQLARLQETGVPTEEDRRAARFCEEHRARFADGIPGGEEFDRAYELRDRRREAQIRLDAAGLTEAEGAELAALDAFFASGLPQAETLAHHEQARAEAARLREENLRLASKTVEMPRYKVPSPLTVPLLLGGGALGLLAGIWKLAGGDSTAGIAALALGILALMAAGWMHHRRSSTRPVAALSPQVQGLVRENEARAAALEAEVAAFTAEYGGASPERIRHRMERLADLAQRDADLARTRRALQEQLAEYDRQLGRFFEKYHCPAGGDSHENLNRFQRLCDAWEWAVRQLKDRDRRLEEHRRETERVQQILAAFEEKFAVAPRTREQVFALREDARQYASLTASARELEERIARFRREHGVISAEPESQADVQALRRREAELLAVQNRNAQGLLRLAQQERQLRENAGRQPELADELKRWQEKKQADEGNAALLDDTMALLTQAREELAGAYMDDLRGSFAALMARMAGEDPDGILVTPELEIRLERSGASRPVSYFSAGQTDTILLCMRLALVDALFREAKPFVILDDPFVNLDDGRTREALALLRDLSRDRQIIYLTCSSSRI